MKAANPLKTRMRRLSRGLAKLYPDARCELDFQSPLQLLIATILSAQCTDVRVNLTTPALFARYPDAAAFAAADEAELQELIRPTGFFRAKARNIQLCCRQLLELHQGDVPATMEELVALAGVGRKTANVILGNAFNIPGLPVDTHVTRLSQRMGLTQATDPVKIELELHQLVPAKEWTMLSHRLIFHGRRVCHARKPKCGECTLARDCPRVGMDR